MRAVAVLQKAGRAAVGVEGRGETNTGGRGIKDLGRDMHNDNVLPFSQADQHEPSTACLVGVDNE